ncbi:MULTISPECIES: DUF3915 family protein [Bacillus cereus group]|uniref:DUF3915 domain-containing protein n=1 Tax=Bacillus cereus TaxID=1396 RepID=A0AA44TDY7_BACCE|nr:MULTISPECIES: DUF3915 family protein [Bacillus cereus group]EEL49513.1 hypothetical protein bcere0022_31960 [Bacillus cereus Rock3-44]PFA24141.1 DUF3915 domain-containing protein [Bacillus cereus]PFN09579.1 DUF3915 domain-containing protein [Bacillus cereus]PFO81487.1 DUF3915 domain-containing protein [Bacillus cereus]PFR25404.1 DUF3915 domain-containing protein [Bacillus cereus]
MFGSFGCCDDFRDRHRERDCHRERDTHREKEDHSKRTAVCNVLANISVGTEISLLSIKGNGTFRNVIFEGFANGVALFSALAMGDDKDNKDDKNNQNTNKFTGILRVCPNDIVAIAI